MELLAHQLAADPVSPRLTVYDETDEFRLDFSAVTLDNWAAKVGNMMLEEFDLTSGATIRLNLPVSWQAVVVVLGALAAKVNVDFEDKPAEVLFATMDSDLGDFGGDVCIVTKDPFGRGVVETGGLIPDSAVDFGPTVRFYGDTFASPTASLFELIDESFTQGVTAGARLLSTGWHDKPSFYHQVLAPIALNGSAVVVSGLVSDSRLDQIAQAEKVTQIL